MNNITACIITNNNPQVIKAIESVYDSVSEIVLCITSEMDIKLYAGICKFDLDRELKINHVHFKWNDSFSDARNYSISKASGDWILIIDSDEIMTAKIEYLNPEYDMYMATVYNGNLPYPNFRIFKNNLGIKFKNKLHETIEHYALTHKWSNSDLEFKHSGCQIEGEELDEKVERNLRIMLTDHDNPVRNYHLGLYYEYKKEYETAIEYFLQSLNDEVNNEHKANACNWAFQCFLKIGTTQIDLLRKSLEYFPLQIRARLEIIGCLTGLLKVTNDYSLKDLALSELEKIKVIDSKLTNDINLSIDFINQKQKEIQQWHLQ